MKAKRIDRALYRLKVRTRTRKRYMSKRAAIAESKGE